MEKFIDHLQYEKNFRPITIQGYKGALKRLWRDLGKHPKPDKATEYMIGMRKKEYSASHINNTACILERWMKFNKKFVKLLRVKKPKSTIKDTLTEGEIARMLAATNNSREKAMIAILAYSGIRNSELCNLTVKDVDLDNGVIKVFDGKGGKDRVAYIPRECITIVSKYLGEYVTNPHLFKTLQRKSKYTSWALRKLVKVVAKRAKIKKRVYPHLMRHSLATNLIKRGANLITVQNQLGHESINTTMLYIKAIPERIQAEYSFYVPNYV